MNISIIAAIAKNNVIGVNGTLPWQLSNDLKWFKQNTMGKAIIMGKNTFKSIGKALPGRDNIILTSDINFKPNGCYVFNNLSSAINEFKSHDELMIIGGQRVYQEALSIANKLYLTIIDREYAGDTFFPEFELNEWNEILSISHVDNDQNNLKYKYTILERK